MLKKFHIHTIFRIPLRMEGLITLGKDILNRLEDKNKIKTKEDERKKKKEGVLEGCLLFSFLLFCLFSSRFVS